MEISLKSVSEWYDVSEPPEEGALPNGVEKFGLPSGVKKFCLHYGEFGVKVTGIFSGERGLEKFEETNPEKLSLISKLIEEYEGPIKTNQ